MTPRLPRVRPRSTAAALALALLAVAPAQVGVLVARSGRRSPAQPAPTVVHAAPDTAPERRAPSVAASARGAGARTKHRPLEAPSRAPAFGGLGAWVDSYDFGAVAPVAAVAVMRAHGVRTLYVQTGRFNTPHAVAPETGPWLVAAHAAGLKVVGWYLPGYRALGKDIARTVAIARYRYRGERFDGLGIDIEEKALVRNVPTWNRRVVQQLRAVRARLPRYPIASITPTPIGMKVAPERWAGFPWRAIGRSSDALMLMSYWTYRAQCPQRPEHCAYGYTLGNIRRARTLMRAPHLPVHIIGGVADGITLGDVQDFVRAARAAHAYGASLYDFRTTSSAFWPVLERLKALAAP